MKTKTTEDRLVEKFGGPEIPLSECCKEYFGCEVAHANDRASRHKLPVPAFRIGSQKSQYFVLASDLAEHIDEQAARAREVWKIHKKGKAA